MTGFLKLRPINVWMTLGMSVHLFVNNVCVFVFKLFSVLVDVEHVLYCRT